MLGPKSRRLLSPKHENGKRTNDGMNENVNKGYMMHDESKCE
jgi:hypothetical protein